MAACVLAPVLGHIPPTIACHLPRQTAAAAAAHCNEWCMPKEYDSAFQSHQALRCIQGEPASLSYRELLTASPTHPLLHLRTTAVGTVSQAAVSIRQLQIKRQSPSVLAFVSVVTDPTPDPFFGRR